MKISVEVSMYPLTEGYIDIIESFISNLNDQDIVVKTNTMSTQIFGDQEKVWRALEIAQKATFEAGHKVALSYKVINSDLNPESKPFGEKYI